MEQASRIKNINKMISLPQLRHMVQYGNATPLFRNASSKHGILEFTTELFFTQRLFLEHG